MLNAILHAKSGKQDEDGDARRWRDVFRAREDHVTSALFERLSYLDGKTAIALLHEATTGPLGGDGAKVFDWRVAELEQIEFWPRWDHPSDTSRSVEPDVFMTWRVGDPEKILHVIVEAKKDAPQKLDQLRGQLFCYEHLAKEDGASADMVAILAIGGSNANYAIHREAIHEKRPGTSLALAHWGDLARGVAKAFKTASGPSHVILSDMHDALTLFGYTHVEFSDLLNHLPPVLPFDPSAWGALA